MASCWPRCFGKKQPEPHWKTKPMKGAAPKPKLPLTDFFKPHELEVLGDLSTRVRVVLDNTLPSTLHGTSSVEDGVPLAIINTQAPDKRYVILHELMHHQLDELGCPSLCCTLQAKEPPDSWLAKTKFPMFVRGLLVQLWELIQHSRFNPMLQRVFGCGPESARDGEYRGYMRRQGLPTYSMCRADGDMAVKRIAVAAHVATVTLEGPRALQKEFAEWVRSTYPGGAEMVALGQALVKCIRGMDLELLRMSRPQLDGIMQGMLDDLHAVLDSLGTKMRVRMGPVKPLREKFNDRCTTVANVDFLAAQGGAVVSVAAGGFGRHAFGSNGAADGWASAARDGDGPASVFRDGGARGEGGEGEGEQVATRESRESVTLSGCRCGGGAQGGCGEWVMPLPPQLGAVQRAGLPPGA